MKLLTIDSLNDSATPTTRGVSSLSAGVSVAAPATVADIVLVIETSLVDDTVDVAATVVAKPGDLAMSAVTVDVAAATVAANSTGLTAESMTNSISSM